MCVVGLNVAMQPCNHRWYLLKRSCSTDTNLANCPEKLKLEGWEQRNEICPFCDESALQTVHESTHRLFGSSSSTSSCGHSTPTSPELGATRQFRSGSGGTLSTLSRSSSAASAASERAQQHQERNERFRTYLMSAPHEVLPSAAKYYPTASTVREVSPSALMANDSLSVRSAGSGSFRRKWKKSVKLGKGMFKG